MKPYKSLFKNTAFIFLGQFASKILTYLLLPLYTYVLTTEEYGTYDFIVTTISLLLPIVTVDIFEACFRFALDENSSQNQIFSIGMYMVLLSIVIVLLLYPVSIFISILNQYYLLFVLLFASNVINTFLMQFIRGCKKVKLYSVCGCVNTIFLLTFNILFLIVFKFGLPGYFFAYILSGLLTNAIIIVSIRAWKYWLPLNKIEMPLFKRLIKYSVPMMPNSICWWISNSSDKYMLQYMSSTVQLGIYSVSYKIPSALSIVSSIFMSAWSISAVEDFGSDESKKMFSNIYNTFFGVISVATSILILLSKYAAGFIYQKDFFIAWKCSVILLLAFLFNCLSAFLGTVYISAKKTNMAFISTSIAAICNIVLNFLLIPIWDVYGAAIATLVSYIVVWCIRLIHTKRIINFKKDNIKHIISILLLFVEAVVILYQIRYCYLLSVCILTIIIFLNLKIVIQLFRKKICKIKNI